MKTIPLSTILETVAADLAHGDDCSPTTIRCAINDLMDAYDKAGCKVNFEYDQPRAIARVQKLIERF
jgi:hypothetical protein